MRQAGDDQMRQVCLEFMTPLWVKKYGGYQETGEKITFITLMDLLLGRLEALTFFHCGGEWAPSVGLREAASQAAVVDKDLQLRRLQRYANRHQQKLPLQGIVGTMTFEGEWAELLPLLRMGEYLHIGASTAFGLGQYKLHVDE
jgi:hypothetical protein